MDPLTVAFLSGTLFGLILGHLVLPITVDLYRAAELRWVPSARRARRRHARQ